MTDVRETWSTEKRKRIDDYHLRRETFSGIGPTRLLEYLKERNEEESKLYFGDEIDFGFNALLNITACQDVDSLPAEIYDAAKHADPKHGLDLVEAFLFLPGVRLTAAMGEPVLRAYIYHLIEHLGLGWCDERKEMADCFIEMHQRRGGSIACNWTQEKLDRWWDDVDS